MGSEATPTLVVAHGGAPDGVSQRLLAIAREAGWPLLVMNADGFSAESIEDIVRLVGAGDPLLVIHVLVFAEGMVDPRSDQIVSIKTACAEEFPSVAFQHWGIVVSGRTLDADELAGFEAIRPELQGVLATVAATSHSAAHTPVDEVCFAGDVAVGLGTTSLGSRLESHKGVWLVAASSVNHAPGNARRTTAERWLSSILERVVSHGSKDTSHALGERWVEGRELNSEAFRAGLVQSPTGAVVQNRVRMEPVEFTSLAPEQWSQAILTSYDMLRIHEMPLVQKQILSNQHEILEREKQTFIDESLAHLGEEGSIETTTAFVEGLRVALARVIDDLGTQEPGIPPTTIERDRDRLRRLVRFLPFGAAAALRIAMATIFTLLVTAAVAGGGAVPMALSSLRIPAMLAAGVFVVGTAVYSWRRRMTVRVRNRLASEVEKQLTLEVEYLVWSTHLELLRSLLSFLGMPGASPAVGEKAESLLSWWVTISDVVESLGAANVTADADDGGEFPESPFAIPVVEVSAGQSAESGIDPPEPAMLLRALAEALRTFVSAAALVVPLGEAVWGLWIQGVAAQIPETASDLIRALEGHPDRIARAKAVLGIDLTPAYGEGLEVARYLILPADDRSSIESLLRPGDRESVSGAFDQLVASLDGASSNFAAVIHVARRAIKKAGAS